MVLDQLVHVVHGTEKPSPEEMLWPRRALDAIVQDADDVLADILQEGKFWKQDMKLAEPFYTDAVPYDFHLCAPFIKIDDETRRPYGIGIKFCRFKGELPWFGWIMGAAGWKCSRDRNKRLGPAKFDAPMQQWYGVSWGSTVAIRPESLLRRELYEPDGGNTLYAIAAKNGRYKCAVLIRQLMVDNGMNPEDGKPTAEQHKEVPRVVHRLQIEESTDAKRRERGKAELRGSFVHKVIGKNNVHGGKR